MPRFINQDSYLGEIVTPPSLHRYLYAFGNPTYYIDPTGHCVGVAGGADTAVCYGLWAGANAAVNTGIDYGFHKLFGDDDQDFKWGQSFGINFAVSTATAGVGAYAKHAPKLKRIGQEAAEFTGSVTGQYLDARAQGLSRDESVLNAVAGTVIGDAAGKVAVKSYQRSKRYLSNQFQAAGRQVDKAKSYFSQKFNSAQNYLKNSFGSSNSQSDISLNTENPNGGSNLTIAPNKIDGTLERDVGLKLNNEIVGGVPQNYAGHHQIGINIAQEYSVMHQAAELGYNINRGPNGIALPTNVATSVETGMPLHSGRHLSARHEGSSDALVHREMRSLQRKYDRGLIDDSTLITEIGKVEDKIRSALENNKVRLQSSDPHWNQGVNNDN